MKKWWAWLVILFIFAVLVLFVMAMVRLIYNADAADWSEPSNAPTFIRDPGPGVKEARIVFKHRESLEQMLIRDEAGSERVQDFLTVQHDGKGLVVAAGHKVLKLDKLDFGDVISLQRAAEFFEADVSHAVIEAHKVVPDFDKHPPDVQIIMVALAYQLGAEGLREFKKMLYAVGQRDYKAAAQHLLDSKLARNDSPNRAAREAKRLQGAK